MASNNKTLAQRIAERASARERDGSYRDFSLAGCGTEKCQALLRTTVQDVTPKLNKFFKNTAADSMRAFQRSGIGSPYSGPNQLTPGTLVYGSGPNPYGHAMVVGNDGQLHDQYGHSVAQDNGYRHPVWVVNPDQAAAGARNMPPARNLSRAAPQQQRTMPAPAPGTPAVRAVTHAATATPLSNPMPGNLPSSAFRNAPQLPTHGLETTNTWQDPKTGQWFNNTTPIAAPTPQTAQQTQWQGGGTNVSSATPTASPSATPSPDAATYAWLQSAMNNTQVGGNADTANYNTEAGMNVGGGPPAPYLIANQQTQNDFYGGGDYQPGQGTMDFPTTGSYYNVVTGEQYDPGAGNQDQNFGGSLQYDPSYGINNLTAYNPDNFNASTQDNIPELGQAPAGGNGWDYSTNQGQVAQTNDGEAWQNFSDELNAASAAAQQDGSFAQTAEDWQAPAQEQQQQSDNSTQDGTAFNEWAQNVGAGLDEWGAPTTGDQQQTEAQTQQQQQPSTDEGDFQQTANSWPAPDALPAGMMPGQETGVFAPAGAFSTPGAGPQYTYNNADSSVYGGDLNPHVGMFGLGAMNAPGGAMPVGAGDTLPMPGRGPSVSDSIRGELGGASDILAMKEAFHGTGNGKIAASKIQTAAPGMRKLGWGGGAAPRTGHAGFALAMSGRPASGAVPGTDHGVDEVHALLEPGEIVLTKEQQRGVAVKDPNKLRADQRRALAKTKRRAA